MSRLDLAAAGVLACVDTMEPRDGLSRVPVGALKDLARALEEASPGLLARVAGEARRAAGVPPLDKLIADCVALAPPIPARSRYLLDSYTGIGCAGCGDEIPAATPRYPADMTGTGRLCSLCERLTGATDYVACTDCPDRPLFGEAEIDEHRKLMHPAKTKETS